MANGKEGRVPPAKLPGTTESFPIPADKLIELAQKVLLEDELGVKNPDVLAPDFRFEFPIVKLDKQKFLEAVGTFDIKAGIPNFDQNPYDWRVDKYEPQRVWFTVRASGTHTGTLQIFKLKVKPTGRKVLGAPECLSFTFNEAGKVTSFTGGSTVGYVMDNRLGTTNKLGGIFGVLQAVGVFVPHPQPGTLGWKVGSAVDTGVNIVKCASGKQHNSRPAPHETHLSDAPRDSTGTPNSGGGRRTLCAQKKNTPILDHTCKHTWGLLVKIVRCGWHRK